MSGEELSATDIKKKKNQDYAEAQRRKKEKKAAQNAKSKESTGSDQSDFTKVDIRVGKITKVWHHPEAEKLFCEEIDIGEECGPRQIASGLRANYELSDMQDKKVLVVCNLKTSKMVGFESQGMVLAAKSEDGSKVELVTPPEDAVIGERIFIEGLSGDPFSSTQMKKKKVWEKVAKKLQTGEGGVATWDGKEIKTSAGACFAATLVGAPIS
jgi:methionine--tRNA ligase beta chain